jgi:8-oxo-dGTP pyrophosphatase MutT (NUDIX family)
MKFSSFSKQVVKLKNLPLPGETSHYKMEPEIRKQFREKGNLIKGKAKKAAVMAIFYPKNEEAHLLLMLRKEYEGVHSKQIGFPGGKVEEGDADLLETAKRETFEEVGIPPNAIQMVKPLSEVYIPPSNFLVQPYLGLYPQIQPFTIDPVEVEALVEVKLVDFLDDTNLMEQRLTTSYAHDILVPAFKLNGYTVWGATAMMLSEVKDLLTKVL